MGNRAGRRQAGLQGYGDPYDPNYGMDYYGGAYDPYGYTGGYGSGYVTTSVNPGRIPYGLGASRGLGMQGGLGLPPKVRAIFIPQGGG